MKKLNIEKRKKDIGVMLRYAPKDYGLYGYVNNDDNKYVFTNAYSLYILNNNYDFGTAKKQLSSEWVSKYFVINESDEENIIYYNCNDTIKAYELMLSHMVYIDNDKKHLMLIEDKEHMKTRATYSIDIKYLKKAIEIMTNGSNDYVIKLNKINYNMYIINDKGESCYLLPCRNF